MSANSKIRSAIEKLRTMWLTSFDARHGKTDFYNYLNGVWTLYAAWKKENTRKENKRIAARLYDLKIRKNTHTIRAIIDASAKDEDPGVKSKWTRALQFAARHSQEIEEPGLVKFLEVNGGVAGCAKKGARRRSKVRPGEKARPG